MQVGIIGAGFIGELHGEAISQVEGLKVGAVCRTNKDELKKVAQKFNAKAYVDYQDLLDDEDIKIVVIATPHNFHTEIALRAAQKGKHIMLEKPMALTLKECDSINAAAEEAKIKLSLGFCHRFAKSFQKVKEIIESGEIGNLVFGSAAMSKFWMEGNRRSWHLDRKTGGGMWLTAGIHCLDRLTWLLDGQVTSVDGQFTTSFHEQNADDAGMIFLRYSNGTCGTVVSLGYKDGAPNHFMEFTGTKGMLAADYNRIYIGKNGVWEKKYDWGTEKWMPHALVSQWENFADALKYDREPEVTGEYSRAIMEAAFAAELSSAKNKEITLPLQKSLELEIERLVDEKN